MKQVLNLSENTQNIILLVAGLILFLYALGIFTCAFRILIIIIAVAMFTTGFIRGGYWNKVRAFIKK